MNEIVAVFAALGYSVGVGPEVETDFYNFECMNFPPAALRATRRTRWWWRTRNAGRCAMHMSGSVVIAEDVTQETFLELLTLGRKFEPGGELCGRSCSGSPAI